MTSVLRLLARRPRGATALSYGLGVGLMALAGLAAMTRGSAAEPVATPEGGADCRTFTAADENTNKGTLCNDGTFYIGHHDYKDGAGQVALFAAACDIGRTFDASLNEGRGGCTGQWDLMAWNDGSQNWFDTSLSNLGSDDEAKADYNGRSATNTLVSNDSSSAKGVQPHEAARGCHGYSEHGHDDWYLPAPGELDILWAAMHPSASVSDNGRQAWFSGGQSSGTDFAQTFDSQIFAGTPGCFTTENKVDQPGNRCIVWAAGEYDSFDTAWHRNLSNGRRFLGLKPTHVAVRCVRR